MDVAQAGRRLAALAPQPIDLQHQTQQQDNLTAEHQRQADPPHFQLADRKRPAQERCPAQEPAAAQQERQPGKSGGFRAASPTVGRGPIGRRQVRMPQAGMGWITTDRLASVACPNRLASARIQNPFDVAQLFGPLPAVVKAGPTASASDDGGRLAPVFVRRSAGAER